MRLMLVDPKAFYPQFATHNAYAIAAAHVAGGTGRVRVPAPARHGRALYDEVVGERQASSRPCRIYAPVGGHEDLLAYLVRRLLENGANTSFVNRLADDEAPVAEIIRDPVEAAEARARRRRPSRSAPSLRPRDIYLPERAAASGLALTEPSVRASCSREMGDALDDVVRGRPDRRRHGHDGRRCRQPRHLPARPARAHRHGAHHRRRRRSTRRSQRAVEGRARLGQAGRRQARAQILEHAADLFERDRARLMAVIVREAGKTLEDAQGDVREAVDFLRYYAAQARRLFVGPVALPGPTGERNTLDAAAAAASSPASSPWNFPLAIFTGQVAAALAAGNAVLAKPAEQTPITAFLATKLLHEAGVPANVLHLLPGSGAVGAALVKDTRIKGIAFTGSNETAWAIQKALADRRGAIVPFIAETGGINAMIADSSALPEQVVRDAVRSAFDSAGPALLGGARAVRAGGYRRPHRSRCWPAPSRRSISAIPSTMRPTSAP